jgi:3-oxoacyl-[acyl-carrier-protein] synthase II
MAYINGLACISHYNTIDENYFFEDISLPEAGSKLLATEPVYKDYIPAALIRRMSHIVKMGVVAGSISMKKAGHEKVDAIITGTGIGCYDDTDKFLRAMLENKEQLLTPTSFIQSTHNTVAGQLALMYKCNGYNFTYVHQNHSFEYALLDALMLLKNKDAETVLVGGIDEINDSIFELFDRAGYIKHEGQTGKGYGIGEGAAFFFLSSVSSVNSYAKINGVKCLQQIANADELMRETESFLKSAGLQLNQVSLVLSGNCGDEQLDKKIAEFNIKTDRPVGYFKRLCGEYFTASSFAIWLAASMLKRQALPQALGVEGRTVQALQHILIVNHYRDKLYSLMCVSVC